MCLSCNYLLAKEGKEKANEFLSFLDEDLNAREGGELAGRITGIDIPVVENLAIGLYGIGAGIDQWASGMKQLFTNELLPTTVEQYANAEIANSLDGFAKYAYTGANVIGNMTPSILLSAVTAGLGAPVAVAQGVGAAAVGMSAAGNAYGSALVDGYSIEQARAYSTLVGVAEGTLQYILGGIGSLGGVTDDLIKAQINMIDNALLRISAKLGVDVLSEISEEELQNFLEPAFRAIIFGEEYDAPTIDEMIETAILTAGTTIFLGGSGTVSNDLAANKLLNVTAQMANDQTNTPYNQEDIAKRLMHQGFNPKKSANMAEVISARLNGQELTKTQIGRLRTALDNAVVRDVITNITKEKAERIDSTQRNGYDEARGSENEHTAIAEGSANNIGQNAAHEGIYAEGGKIVSQLLKETTCSNDKLYVYLSKQVGTDAAEAFAKNGTWPYEVQIPKNSSALKSDGSINWSRAPQGGYVLDADGNAIKEAFTPKIGEVIDRYGPANGRYTSPVIDDKAFSYSERSLPYVEDASKYHRYEVTGDFTKIEEYVKKCANSELKGKIDAAVTAYYDGDYSKLVSYRGKVAGIEDWGNGGATQYEFSLSIEQLVELGLLKEIK